MQPMLFGYWDSPKIPDDILTLQETWRKHWPYGITIYDNDQARDFVAKYYDQSTLELYDIIRFPAMKSDFFRVLRLFKLGGVYLDMGVRLGPNPSYLMPREYLTVMRKWHGAIWNGFASCEPENDVIKIILDTVVENLKSRKAVDVVRVTGPYVWTVTVDNYDGHIHILDQREDIIKNDVFKIINDLEHKKDGRHWSEKQKKHSFYLS